MSQLVRIENGRPVTDSLKVAESFGKEHARVLRDIRDLECSDEFRVGNFAESTYINGQGRETPRYIISEQGFAFLVMGYTGKEAARFKELYIAEFGRMREEVSAKALPPMSSIEMIAVIASQAVEQERRMREMEARVETIANGLTAVPDHTDVVARVNEYARWARIGHNEVYNLIYEKLQARHGIDVRTRVENERIKLNRAYFAEKGRYYSESTLKSKVNGIDVMVRNGWLDKFNEILVGLLASLKERSLTAPTR